MDENKKDPEKTVIIDFGTRMIRAGFSGEESPRVEFPNVVATPKRESMLIALGSNQTLFGEEAEEKKSVAFNIRYPITNGIITNRDVLIQILDNALQKLAVDTSECRLLLVAESTDKEKLLEVLFEKYNPSAIFLANQALLSLSASGHSNGLVINFGEGTSHVVPIIENQVLQDLVNTWGCNGQNFTEKLMGMLEIPKTPNGFKCAREIKKEYCFVAVGPEEEKEEVESISYKTEDEDQVTIGPERFQCPEVLFQEYRIQDVVVKTIKKCNEDKQEVLYKNIVLAGGSTMLKGFPERLEKEIKALVGGETEINIIAPGERMHSAWKGGSKVASEGLFPDNWITREEYKK